MRIFLSLLLAVQVPMGGVTASSGGIAIVQHKAAENALTAAAITVSGLTASTAGNNLIVCFGNVNATLVASTVVDNGSGGSNTYTQATSARGNMPTGDVASDCWYSLNTTHGGVTSVTVTLNATCQYRSIEVWEVSGVTTFDVGANASGTASTTDINGPATTTTAKGFIAAYAVPVNSISVNPKAGNAFTSGGDLAGSGPAAASLITSASGTYTPVWTDNISADLFATSTAAFK